MKFLGVTILQGLEFPIFLFIFTWALQQCSATALPVMAMAEMKKYNFSLKSPAGDLSEKLLNY